MSKIVMHQWNDAWTMQWNGASFISWNIYWNIQNFQELKIWNKILK